MANYYLHRDIWDPALSPPTGIFEYLLNQTRYPLLYSLSKVLVPPGKPYWDMGEVEALAGNREYWEELYFVYPATFTTPINSLWALYERAMTGTPESFGGDFLYDPTRIQRSVVLIGRQREFVLQFLNAYLSRTETHHEIMFNRLADEEQFNGIAHGVWGVARAQWLRMPDL